MPNELINPNLCRILDCRNVATTTLEAVDKEGIIFDEAKLCAACKEQFLTGYWQMKSEERALRDQGVSEEELQRILVTRVENGDYS